MQTVHSNFRNLNSFLENFGKILTHPKTSVIRDVAFVGSVALCTGFIIYYERQMSKIEISREKSITILNRDLLAIKIHALVGTIFLLLASFVPSLFGVTFAICFVVDFVFIPKEIADWAYPSEKTK